MDIKLIDVTSWRVDDEHGIFPRGARDKKMLWSPENPPEGILPNWSYLFKLSREAFPDQFWMETVAYVVGDAMDVPVPKAFPAKRAIGDGVYECGALLEWFYDQSRQIFVHASDFFHSLITDFDDKSGKHHNLKDLHFIFNTFSANGRISPDWREWVLDMFLFDALIGNSDRHQENWGFVFTHQADPGMESSKLTGHPSPYFDNGTSLGYERYTEKVRGWTQCELDNYIQKGCHHLRKTPDDTNRRLGHLSFIQALALNIEGRVYLTKKLTFDLEMLVEKIYSLCEINSDVPFTTERADWTIRLLRRRYQRLSLILTMRTISKIIEPTRLLLTWQPPTGGARYVVGQIDRQQNNEYIFYYHVESGDFKKAQQKGFDGHPAFDMECEQHKNNVLDPFIRRLPPKKRKDFAEYLDQHLLHNPFGGSDFALLGYTGAKSPGDGFCLTFDPSIFNSEGELLLEVAGTRYYQKGIDLSKIIVGDIVSLVAEPDNPVDPHAIAVMHEQCKLGYINKVLCQQLKRKISQNKVSAFVAKKNGTPERPLIYLFVECRV